MNDQREKAGPTLEEVYKLTRENNHMLHAMRRDAFVGGILKFVFWVAVFFVIPYILYVMYVQPYLETIQSAYTNLNDNANTLSGAAKDLEALKNQVPNFEAFLKQFGGGQ